MRMVYARGRGRTRNVSVPRPERERFCIDDTDVLELAGYAIAIEDHYSANAGHPMPMSRFTRAGSMRGKAVRAPRLSLGTRAPETASTIARCID